MTGGAWSINVTAAQAQALADGSYSIKANVSDTAGNAATTASQTITVDETAPTIAITSPVAGDNIINKTEAAAGVAISGTATAGSGGAAVNGQTATITIVDSTNAVKDTYTATVTGGAWSINVTAAQAQALADGSYSIKANVSDTAGNAATTASQAIAVDTVAPTVTISTSGTTTNQATQTISGTVTTTEAAAGATVALYDTVNGVTTQIGTANVVGGTWSTNVTLAGNGTHSIVAQDTDAAGNIGSSAPVVFTLATAAPTIAITSPVAGDNIINKTEAAAGVTISGTATAGSGGAAVNGQTATITIVDSTNAVKDTYTATVTGGAWSINVTAAQAQALADGSYSIKANVSDTAGNAATTASQTITVDETAPTIAITSPVAGDNIINKTEAAAGVAISGTATAGSGGAAVNGQTATITIVDSTNAVKDTYTATVTGGAWSINVTAAQAQALADGSYSIKANVSDTAGNAATTASQTITVDETAPTIAITSPVAGDNIINKTEAAAGVAISGTATAGSGGAAVNGQTATITIVDSTNAVKDTYTATVTGGAWSINVTAAQAQALADGSYSIKANVSDTAGNAATTASQTITVDETAPTIAITSPVAGDNIINKTEAAAGVAISGTATAGSGGAAVNGQTATITIVDSTNAVKDTYTATVTGGAWSINVTAAQAQALADGSYSIKANVSDTAGNAATTASQAITVDTVAPTVLISTSGTTTNQATQTISGTVTTTEAAAGATVALYDTVNGVTTQIGTANVVGGTWSTNVTLAGNGTHSIVAQDTDAAGNIGSSAPVVFTLATAAPTIAITSPVAGDNIINKTEAAAGVAISGTATAGSGGAAVNGQTATITIVDSTNAVKDTYTATVTGGAWSINVTAAQAQALADGSYSIKANVSDTAGNAATTASQTITVDETAPTIAITSPVAGDNIINKTEAAAGVAISGTATAGSGGAAVNGQTATITIVDSTNAVKDTYTATVTGGAWSINVTAAQAQALADGSYSIKANVSDTAGNAATTASQTITVDETAPTIAITSPVAGDNIINKTEAAAGVAISGTATAGSGGAAVNGQTATITIVDSTNAVKDTYTATVTGGAWSINVTAAQAQALADGSYSIKANVSDTAGNAATTASQTITVDETAPTIAITSPVAGDNIINKTEAAAGVAISGTATVGSGGAAVNGQTATITIVDSTNAVKDTYTATVTGGAWSINVTAAQAQALADGSYSIKANVSDTAGNAATTASQAIAVDTVAPAVTISTSGTTTNQATQTITGTVTTTEAAAGATVALYDTVNGVTTQIGTANVVGGTWSTNVTLAGNGTHSIVARDTDAAGNIGSSAPITFNLTVTSGGWGSPAGGSWNSAANWSSGTVPGATTNVVFNPVGAAAPYVVTIPSATLVTVNSITLNDPNITLLDEGTLAIAVSLVETSGIFQIANGGTLSLGGGSSLVIDFAGTGGNLILGSSPGFTGTIDAVSTATGAVTISEIGAVTTSSGDAIDLLGSGGTLASPANLGISLAGAITGAATGISAIQNGYGSVSIVTTGAVKGNSGDGIIAEDLNASDNSALTVDASGNVSGSSFGIYALTDSSGLLTVAVGANVDITGQAPAIQAVSAGVGNIFVTTGTGDVITSNSTGINVNNQATAIPLADASTITVTAYGTIDSGPILTSSGNQPAGILAGYRGGTTNTTNPNVFGNVTINNYATITASGGDGIRGYNYGVGNITITDEANTTIIAPSEFGVRANNYGSGSISFTTSNGDVIISGASGLSAINNAAAIAQAAGSTINVVAHGTINSGTNLNPSGSQPQSISAGYYGANGVANFAINGSVSVDNFANIAAPAGWGIDAFSYGNGPVTLTDELGTTVKGAQYGIGAYSNAANGTASTNGATSTTSPTLNLASTPPWVVAGMAVYDVTTGKTIGAVSSTAGTTVTLTANAANAVASGDILSFAAVAASTNAATPISSNVLNFASTPPWIVAGMTVYDTATGKTIGTVASTTNTTVTLTANAANAVASGDTLSFGTVSVNVLSGATITAGSLFELIGIQADTNNAFNVSVTTSTGDLINSGGTGINSNNASTNVPFGSQISITANGTINSGFDMFNGGGQPGGIVAGYNNNGSNTVNSGIAGAVVVDSYATINSAAGFGIELYNWGVGGVSVTLESSSAITAPKTGVTAVASGGGNVTISNSGTIVVNFQNGIFAQTGTGVANGVSGQLTITNSGSIMSLGSLNAVVGINNGSTKAATFTNTGSVTASLYETSPFNSAIGDSTGAVTISNSGIISGNMNLGPASTFNNLIGGVWNGRGYSNFGTGANTLTNSGTINLSATSGIVVNSSGTLALTNTGTINVAAIGAAYITGAVSGTGTFNIGDRASLEFASAVASGQTVSFSGNKGMLTLDNPSGFIIAGLAVGDIITLRGPAITANPSISGSTLSVTQNGVATPLSYTVSGTLTGNTFSLLSSNTIVLVPTTANLLTGALGGQSYTTPTTAQFYQLSGATISSSSGTGLNIAASDSNAADTMLTEINQSSSISVTGAFTGMNVSTTGANIAIISAGSIISTGGIGLLTNSGAGSTTIVDYGNVSGTAAIEAVTGGTTTTSAATTTSSNTLSFTSTPYWIVAGLTVYDLTTGKSIGSVLSTTSTSVTLTANAVNAVGSGDTLSFGAPTATTIAATSTSSNTLSFASTPSWIVAGTSVYDATTGQGVGTVSSTANTTVTLTANAANNVGSGDTLLFTGPLSIIVGGAATISGGPTSTTSAATATTSNTLSFGSTLSWIVAGMTVYDDTTGKNIGTVLSNSSTATSTTVTLTANAANAVGSGDTLSFFTATSLGIFALTTSGSASVTTQGSAFINSGRTGILVQNQGHVVPPSSLTVEAAGIITSGLVSGGYPAAISVSYLGGTSGPASIPNPPLSGIFGNITVDSTATITAYTGVGINAFTYGTGNVSISNSGSITATAAGNTNGTGSPTTAQYGINASNYGNGNITVVDATSGTITSGSTGIFASNVAIGALATQVGTKAAPVTVTVVALGAITSGVYLPNGGNAPAGIIASVDPGGILGYNGFVYGDVLVNAAGTITAQAGDGIRAINHGQGDVAVNIGNNATITALNTPTGASGNLSPYGIGAYAYGPGDIAVTTSNGDLISSGSTGIDATQLATAIATTANALVTVNAAGTINSGNVQTNNASTPAGISAGFLGGTSVAANLNVNGSVIVNNDATITIAGGRGISAYNYGNGDVTINDAGNVTVNGSAILANSTATTTTQASEYGIQASAVGGGTGNVAINVYSGATISATSTSASITNPIYGLFAFSTDSGNISVITNSGSSITSSGAGIDAVNEDSLVATLTATTNGVTSISSPTLNFASTPSWIVNGMPVYDVTTGKSVGAVSSITGNTVALTANATNAVGSGDTLSFAPIQATSVATSTSSPTLNFAATPSWIVTGMTVYDVTTGKTIGTVASTTGTAVTLTANAASAVGIGDALSFPETATTTLATSTSSPILSFAATPSWAVAGMTVYDVTTGRVVGTVSSSTGTTVTLAANAANAVAIGDTLSFATSSIVVTSYSTISSGAVVTGTGSPPAGIIAGYLGGGAIPTAFPLTGVFGDVTVNNFGNITAAAGDGIRAFTYGIGNVTVNEDAGTIAALGSSSPTNGFGDGINASNRGPGDILVTTATGVVINSGSSGISALNYAPAPSTNTFSVPSTSDVTVIAHGTITSGTIPTLSGDPAAGILAGYNPGVTNTNQVDAVNANVAGNVLIDDYATITAAAGTDGIRGINYGTGSVTIIAETGTTITGGRYGIGAFAFDGGNVSITNHAYVAGSTAAIDALSTSTGTVFIDNYGAIAGDVVSSGNATFHNEAGAVWNLAGSSTFAGTSELINDGIVDTTGVSSITTSSVLTLVNFGVLEVQSGSLDVGAAVTGSGTFTIDGGGLLEFAASVSSGSVVTFDGTAATLKLDQVAQFGGSVTGFAFGDTIDLVGINPANVSVSNSGSLQISYGAGFIALGGHYNPADFTVGSDGLVGTDITWNHQAPLISTSGLTVTQNGATTTITGLQVSDSDAAASTETFTITATTGAASSGTGVSPSTGSGLLTAINTELGTGITYNPGTTPPSTDNVTLSVTDGFGATDTVNFVFNLASNPSTPVTLTGTPGKDVIFATGFNDTLTGGGGSDQFVFNQTTGAHTITDFSPIIDHIDLTALSSIVTAATLNAWLASNVKASTTSPADTLISLGSSETITLHDVLAANIHASDFFVHA